jgi:hypothetical protein
VIFANGAQVAIGSHAVTCGCISGPQIEILLDNRPVDVLYTRPPWGDSQMKRFHTMARENEWPLLTHRALYERLSSLIQKHIHGWIFIETGLRQAEEVEEHMRLAQVCNRRWWHVTYTFAGQIRECMLFQGHTEDWRELPDFNPMPYRGLELAIYCLQAVQHPGATVFDPCCGTGDTARAARAARMRFLGNDLDAKRLLRTVHSLRRKGNP